MVIDVLAVHPEINVIFAINDDSAQGALDAYRAAGLDERKLLVVAFGSGGSGIAAIAARKAGRSRPAWPCSRRWSAERASMPRCAPITTVRCRGAIMTPYAVVTGDTLEQYYRWEPQTGASLINWACGRAVACRPMPALGCWVTAVGVPGPRGIGWVQVFSSHDWYRNIRRTMQEYSRSLGIQLEVLDASQDVEQEVEAFKRAIGCAAARLCERRRYDYPRCGRHNRSIWRAPCGGGAASPSSRTRCRSSPNWPINPGSRWCRAAA